MTDQTQQAATIGNYQIKRGAGFDSEAFMSVEHMPSGCGQDFFERTDMFMFKFLESLAAAPAVGAPVIAMQSAASPIRPFAEVVQVNQGRYFTALAAVGVDAPPVGTKLFMRHPATAPARGGSEPGLREALEMLYDVAFQDGESPDAQRVQRKELAVELAFRTLATQEKP